jgi:OOP family OmpA-OmpF porin
MNKQLKLGALVAALVLSSSAFAVKPGYAVDQTTDAVTRNNYNECWHTGFFNKATQGLVECGDREPTKVVEQKPQPQPTYYKEKVTLSSEVLFDFDKAVLRADAKNELDPVANRLKDDANLKSVAIEGHTDYRGSDSYNMDLSRRRAEAVRTYFVSAGVPSDKVSAEGKGETVPKVKDECTTQFPKDSKLRKTSARLKTCLQPDRRVEITIESAKVTQQ